MAGEVLAARLIASLINLRNFLTNTVRLVNIRIHKAIFFVFARIGSCLVVLVRVLDHFNPLFLLARVLRKSDFLLGNDNIAVAFLSLRGTRSSIGLLLLLLIRPIR